VRLQSHFKPTFFLSTVLVLASVNTSAIEAIFEYKLVELRKVNVKTTPEIEKLLNQFGAEGWELIEINSLAGTAILKRKR